MYRATFCAALLLTALGGCERTSPPSQAAIATLAPDAEDATRAAYEQLEQRSGGRLGVAVVDGTGRAIIAYRPTERFAMCSTFKLPMAAMLLDQATKGAIDASDEVDYVVSELPDHSPNLIEWAKDGRGSAALSRAANAAVVTSDNGAANIVLAALGGPSALTAQLRDWGDAVTRLDRKEPDLNTNIPGDARDTTSPLAMAGLMRGLFAGGLLSDGDVTTLTGWSRNVATGMARIRAVVARTMDAGDKTGTCGGDNPAYNDIAWVKSRGGNMADGLFIAIYLDRPRVEGDGANAIIAEAAQLALNRAAAIRANTAR